MSTWSACAFTTSVTLLIVTFVLLYSGCAMPRSAALLLLLLVAG